MEQAMRALALSDDVDVQSTQRKTCTIEFQSKQTAIHEN